MNSVRTACVKPVRGFTLVELMVTIAIIAIVSSLGLAGLGVARQRAKADRTEITIRKIHEAVMPHYEQFANRKPPHPDFSFPASSTLQQLGEKGVMLIAKRRMMALELPDGWKDLLQQSDPAGSAVPPWAPTVWPTYPPYQSGISKRFFTIASGLNLSKVSETYGDAECLWLSVMRGGYADPGIIGHFREDEFGDQDNDGQREFIDGWGNPIRFLRWAPGFVSRYQPDPNTDTTAHDAFDLAAVDPFANKTLFPLIYSMGPDGEPDVAGRDQTALADFSYPEVGYDPWFASRPVVQGQKYHLSFAIRGVADAVVLGRHLISQPVDKSLGTVAASVSDDVHNHSMSR